MMETMALGPRVPDGCQVFRLHAESCDIATSHRIILRAYVKTVTLMGLTFSMPEASRIS